MSKAAGKTEDSDDRPLPQTQPGPSSQTQPEVPPRRVNCPDATTDARVDRYEHMSLRELRQEAFDLRLSSRAIKNMPKQALLDFLRSQVNVSPVSYTHLTLPTKA